MINLLTIGYIPSDWDGNEEGEAVVEIGNAEFSRVSEAVFQVVSEPGVIDFEGMRISDSLHKNLQLVKKFSKLLEEKINCTLDPTFLLYVLSAYFDGDFAKIAPGQNTAIELISTEGCEINVNKKNKGKAYIQGRDEDEDKDYLTLMKAKPKK